jgi:hypothetical protein
MKEALFIYIYSIFKYGRVLRLDKNLEIRKISLSGVGTGLMEMGAQLEP